MVTYSKIKWEDIPKDIRDSITEYNDFEIIFDDTLYNALSTAKKTAVDNYLTSRGYRSNG